MRRRHGLQIAAMGVEGKERLFVPSAVVAVTLPPSLFSDVTLEFSNSLAPALAAAFAVPASSFSGWMWPVPVSRRPPR
jgi:hypothetical protein